MNCVEIFSGVGGLGMGATKAGFKSIASIEMDKSCIETLKMNQLRKLELVQNWPLICDDVANINYGEISNGVDLLCAGPPCQPFSIGGKHLAYHDDRDMFQHIAKAVRELAPRAFIIENVRGLARPSLVNYLNYVLLLLEFPEIHKRRSEEWDQHNIRLERYKTSRRRSGLNYNIVFRLLNAADFGVPQKRQRVFIVGFRSDINAKWTFGPNLQTHSVEALMRSQWITGQYWEGHRIAKKNRPSIPEAWLQRIAELRQQPDAALGLPWSTVRDAISDLPEPRLSGKINGHVLRPGARAYTGHSGSLADMPSKTIKAGHHGVPGGENMYSKSDGTVRYFSVRECARLQTFPDDFYFAGTWSSTMRQIGNAVPVALAHRIAKSVATQLRGDMEGGKLTIKK